MNRRLLLQPASALVAVSLFALACGSSGPTAVPTVGPGASPIASLPALPSIALPSIALPSFAVPSLVLPSVAIPSVALPPASGGLPSFGIPSFAIPSFAIPSGLGSFAIPSLQLPSEDKDLEARLPSSLNGVTFIKASYSGATFLASGGTNTEDIVALLSSLGKSPGDLSVAYAGDQAGNLDVQLGAFRIRGADSNALLQAFIVISLKQSPGDQITQVSAGGKNVTQIVDPTDPTSGTAYVYANGDTLFYVSSPDPALAGAAVQALP